MVDLHIHTNNSDGHATVHQILMLAEKQKLSTISITDHNTVKAYEILKNANTAKLFSGKIVPGIEMHCASGENCIELIGYGIDCTKMKNLLKQINYEKIFDELYKAQFAKLLSVFKNLGIRYEADVDYKFLKKNSTVFFIKKYIFCHSENKKFFDDAVWNNYKLFSRICMANKTSEFYFPTHLYLPDAKKVAQIIRQSGGKVFLAHPFIYGLGYGTTENKKINIIKDFLTSLISEISLDGIECYHPSTTDKQTIFLLNFAKQNNLLISGGSDFHATTKPYRLGEYNINSDWLV